VSVDSGVTGVLVLDKPAGMTSHDVVDRIRRLFRTRRVGHTGTLDPDATGVLVLCLGTATRLAEYLSTSAKHYTAEVVFGVTTDTMDGSGVALSESDAAHLSRESVLALLPRFRGKILQVPPMVSARHHQGKRLYELAREGLTVERVAREVEISSLELTEFTAGTAARATLEITCSTGTYIRVLADDLGTAAGTGAHMRSLRRTWVGMDEATAFTLAEAHRLEQLAQDSDAGTVITTLLPLADALRALPHLRLTDDGLRRLRNGQSIGVVEIASATGRALIDGPLAAVLDDQGRVCAVVESGNDMLRPIKVLSPI
jgi:tRNA pseudouridine55 synthase